MCGVSTVIASCFTTCSRKAELKCNQDQILRDFVHFPTEKEQQIFKLEKFLLRRSEANEATEQVWGLSAAA